MDGKSTVNVRRNRFFVSPDGAGLILIFGLHDRGGIRFFNDGDGDACINI